MATACGRIGFEAQSQTDAHDPAITDGAAQVDAAPMVASGPFNPPKRIDELVDGAIDDDDPTLPGDMLEIYFKRDLGPPAPRSDIFVSTRASVADAWSTPVRVDELSTDGVDDSPEISFDGLTIRISSDRNGLVDIYRSTRANRTAAWSTPVRVPELSSPGGDYAAAPDRGDLRVVLTRFLDGSAELLEARRSSSGGLWESPTLISELNTPAGYEADAALGESGLRIFYVSDVGGGQRDVVSARRSALDQPFVPDAPIEGVNTGDNEEDPWISEDLATIFFVSDAGGAKHIYTATRPLGP
jgi:hypothetical protein